MPTNNRGGNRGGGRNNNPEGRNQYSGVISSARENPLSIAAALGAVAAGVFLWSRRNQISDQIGNLADQITDWRDGMRADEGAGEIAEDENIASSAQVAGGDRRTQAQISEEALTLKTTGAAE